MMGLYKTTFPSKIGHGTTLGRSFRTLRVHTRSFMGSGMPDLPLIPRMDMTLHPFSQKNLKHQKKNIPEHFEKTNGLSKHKYKDQNDRNAKIYRFQWSFDIFLLKNQSK